MKTILEMQEELEREMTAMYQLHITDYTPRYGGVIDIMHDRDCVYSETFQTIPEAFEMALKYFKDVKNGVISPTPLKRLTPRGFIDAFCTVIKVPKEDLLKKSRKRHLVQARQTITALIHLNLMGKYSLMEIGRAVSKDHATVLYSKRVVENLLETSQRYRDYYKDVVNGLNKNLGSIIQTHGTNSN